MAGCGCDDADSRLAADSLCFLAAALAAAICSRRAADELLTARLPSLGSLSFVDEENGALLVEVRFAGDTNASPRAGLGFAGRDDAMVLVPLPIFDSELFGPPIDEPFGNAEGFFTGDAAL